MPNLLQNNLKFNAGIFLTIFAGVILSGCGGGGGGSDGNANISASSISSTITNLPPVVSSVSIKDAWNVNPFDTIRAIPPTYSDPENAALTLTYEWRCGSQTLMEGQNGELPPGRCKARDLVTVTAKVSDGVNTVQVISDAVLVGIGPATYRISNVPESTTVGETVSFDAQIFDPDNNGEPTPLKILEAPEGTTIDAKGRVSWVATDSFLGQYVYRKFVFDVSALTDSATADHSGKQKETFLVSVEDKNKNLPIARSGVIVPSKPFSMWVGDFDGDNNNELLLTDNKQGLSLLSFNGTNYIEKWTYPYLLDAKGNIIRALKAPRNGNNQSDIVVVTTRTFQLISDLNRPAKKMVTLSDQYFVAAQVYDIDGDGSPELIAIVTNLEQRSNDEKNNLLVFDLSSGELKKDLPLDSPSTELVVGNLDDDSNIEIAFSNGTVYDATTWNLKWNYGSPFGEYMSIGKTHNTGPNEIFSARWGGWGKYYEINVPAKTVSEFKLPFDNQCSLLVAKVDPDPLPSPVIGNCDDHIKTIAVGDIDNDGSSDVIKTGGNRFLPESILSIESKGYTSSWVSQNYLPQLNGFTAAGWAKITPAEETKATFVTSYNSLSASLQHVIFLGTDGSYSASESIANEPIINLFAAKADDYKGDGFSGIFLPSASSSHKLLAAKKLNDMSDLWLSGLLPLENSIRYVDSGDLNNDGTPDAIYIENGQVSGGKIVSVDVKNSTIIEENIVASEGNQIWDFAVVKRPDLNTIDIVVAATNELMIWRKEANAFVLKFSTPFVCSRVIARESGGNVDVYCLGTSNSNNLLYVAYSNDGFSSTESWTLEDSITDMAFSNIKTDYIYLGIKVDPSLGLSSLYRPNSAIALFNLSTMRIEERTDLVGATMSNGGSSIASRSIFERVTSDGKPQIMFATDGAMYILKQ